MDVTWEDQQMINTFGRLTNKRHDIDADLKGAYSVLPDVTA